MEKKWQDLTQSEKIEDLRADVKKIFSVLIATQETIRILNNKIADSINLSNEALDLVNSLSKPQTP
jgi:hypothetical protein